MQKPTFMPDADELVSRLADVSTDQIQKYLDENKQLILAILENQNLGKLTECAQYQAQLQKNLLYLAAIADAQPPQNPGSRPQMVQPGGMPGAGHYMSQVPMFPPRTPLTPQQMQEQQHQQLQQQQAQALAFPSQMVMRPGTVNGMQPMQADLQAAAAAPGLADSRGSKQDAAVAGAISEPSGTESHKSTGADHEAGGDVAEQS
ncbi:GRF1-interacting factor 2 isoform X2 [Brachypodium distachyon]|uniref:GRF1-interacting factor 2 isoform X2 n=1 Tax=Brachypodium distachyon TaxID=15368 RepID=UPI0001C708AA|nr:GRF1-interacting factor 2 isoform X2 [Brachypodium distachyon]|eukprot:XP_024310834.1 GRF1-interacting factor 2 isoform X2 [Brachypodium distachyon]